MLVVIDTTETFKHPLFTGAEWSLVGTYLQRDEARLVVPAIVLSETVSHFPAKLEEALSETRRAIGRLTKIMPRIVLDSPVVDASSALTEYEEALRSRLNELHAIVPGFENIGLDRIVRKSIQRMKPFDAKGRGLHDAILWEAVVELGRTHPDETAILVTGNTRDFGPHGSLDADLIADLDENGIGRDRVIVCDGLGRFVDTYVKPALNRLDDLQLELQERSHSLLDMLYVFADAYPAITDAIRLRVRDWEFRELDHFTRGFFHSPRLVHLEEGGDVRFEVGEVYRVGDGSVAFSTTFFLEGSIECDEVHYHSPHERPSASLFVGGAEFAVVTWQQMEEATGQIEGLSVEDVTISPNYCWPCDDPD